MIETLQSGLDLPPWLIILLTAALSLCLSFLLPLLPTLRRLETGPPQDNPLHRRGSKSKAGGLAVVVSALVIGGLAIGTMSPWRPLAIYTGGLLLVGLLDDMHPLTPLWKIILQVPVSLLVVLSIPRIGLLHIGIPWVLMQVTWLTVMTHGFNIIDIADGVLAGIAVPTLAAMGWILVDHGPVDVGLLSLALAGGLLGFLPRNIAPGRLMLGDTGSLPVGGFLALIVLLLPARVLPGPGLVWAFPLAGVAFIEVTWVSLARIRRGIPPWRASPHHFIYWLQARGLPSDWTALALSAVQCLLIVPVGLVAGWGWGLMMGACLLLLGPGVWAKRRRRHSS